jgi:hypothetical protein
VPARHRPPPGDGPPPAPGITLSQRLQSREFWNDVGVRARQQWLAVIVLGFLAYLDYRLHRNGFVSLVFFFAGIAATLFIREGVKWIRTGLNLTNIPDWAGSLFVTIPAALFFLVRGKGTLDDSAAMLIMAAIIGLPLLFTLYIDRVDPSIAGLYDVRNQVLPVVIRPLVMIVVSLIVTFGIGHGDLGDIKILVGKTADKRMAPESGKIVLTVVLNIVIGFMFLHEPKKAPLE